jgi:hypothetical protein
VTRAKTKLEPKMLACFVLLFGRFADLYLGIEDTCRQAHGACSFNFVQHPLQAIRCTAFVNMPNTRDLFLVVAHKPAASNMLSMLEHISYIILY